MEKKKILTALILVILAFLGGTLLLMTRQAKAPLLVSRTDPPKIRFEKETHELGTVTEGVEIPYVFKIHNIGGEPLVIKNVSTSCGCVVLNLKSKYIEPGKTGDLEVIIDTTLKQGYVKKQIDVYSNDPNNPKISLFLIANVLPSDSSFELGSSSESPSKASVAGSLNKNASRDPHAKLADKDRRSKIFQGRCATCHVDQGKGKTAGDLFQADCAMCHGQNAEGGVGPALIPGSYHEQDFINRTQKIIRYGSDSNLSMPGYLKEAGGPLTDDEINSIVEYLENKSDHMKNQTSEVPGG